MNDTAALRREVGVLKTRVMALENELRTVLPAHDWRLDYVERAIEAIDKRLANQP